MKLYKLTDADGYTRRGESNETLWGVNVTHSASGTGTTLCTSDVIHAYEHPLIAVFMNPLHANTPNPVLWEAEGEVVAREGQLKCGVKTLTTLRRIPLPEITLAQRIRIAIYCALEQCRTFKFVTWATNYLSGSDTSVQSATEMASSVSFTAGACAAYAAAAYANRTYTSSGSIAAMVQARLATARAARRAELAHDVKLAAKQRAAEAAEITSVYGTAAFDLLAIIIAVVEKEK